MITVGMNYHVIEGKQQDFEEKFAGVIDALRAADGHTSSTLWKDVSDNASYLITSEWSDEIEVRPMLRFFVAKASTADRLVGVASGLGHAEAEVFRFHDGRWWSKKFKVEPGDRIGALVSPRRGRGAEGPAAKPVDFGTDWFVLDIIATIGASRSGLGDQTASKVLLQCLSTGVVAPPRDPRDEAADLDREWLTDEVEAADSRAG